MSIATIETFRLYVSHRVSERLIEEISFLADGSAQFSVTPPVSDYFWILDLAGRMHLKAETDKGNNSIKIVQEK